MNGKNLTSRFVRTISSSPIKHKRPKDMSLQLQIGKVSLQPLHVGPLDIIGPLNNVGPLSVGSLGVGSCTAEALDGLPLGLYPLFLVMCVLMLLHMILSDESLAANIT